MSGLDALTQGYSRSLIGPIRRGRRYEERGRRSSGLGSTLNSCAALYFVEQSIAKRREERKRRGGRRRKEVQVYGKISGDRSRDTDCCCEEIEGEGGWRNERCGRFTLIKVCVSLREEACGCRYADLLYTGHTVILKGYTHGSNRPKSIST